MARYDGSFDMGWDLLRERRMQRLRDEGLVDEGTVPSGRDPTQPAWDDAEHKAWQLRRMQVYAAQIDRVDQGVGRVLAELERGGRLDDTLLIFLSDNGASRRSAAAGGTRALQAAPRHPAPANARRPRSAGRQRRPA